MQAVGASEKVFEYIDRKPEIAMYSGMLAPSRLSGQIEFRNVQFSYPGRPGTVVLKVVLKLDFSHFTFYILFLAMWPDNSRHKNIKKREFT